MDPVKSLLIPTPYCENGEIKPRATKKRSFAGEKFKYVRSAISRQKGLAVGLEMKIIRAKKEKVNPLMWLTSKALFLS